MRHTFSLLLGLGLLAACSIDIGAPDNLPDGLSGEQATTTAMWMLRGTMRDSTLSGGRVLALASDGSVYETAISSTLDFNLEAPGGKTYAIHFMRADEFVAVMFFKKNGSTGEHTNLLTLPERSTTTMSRLSPKSSVLDASISGLGGGTESADDEGEGAIDFGEVDTDGGVATPENNPNEQIDTDHDGSADYDDDDDDNDGVADTEEQQEDIDGSAIGFFVKDVEPGPGDDDVSPKEDIKIKFSAAVDPTSITAETIVLLGPGDTVVIGEFELDDDDDDTREIKLDPTDALQDGAEYTLLISDVLSRDGETLSAAFSSTFKVSAEHDEGDDGEDAESDDKGDDDHGSYDGDHEDDGDDDGYVGDDDDGDHEGGSHADEDEDDGDDDDQEAEDD